MGLRRKITRERARGAGRDLVGAQIGAARGCCRQWWWSIDLWSCRRNLPRAAVSERPGRARALAPVSFSSSRASASSSPSSCAPGYRALPSWISSLRSTSRSVHYATYHTAAAYLALSLMASIRRFRPRPRRPHAGPVYRPSIRRIKPSRLWLSVFPEHLTVSAPDLLF